MSPRGPDIALRDASWGMDGGGAPLRVPLRPTSAMGSAMGSGMGSLGVASAGSAPGTKKMRKRRELDALAKRCPTSNGVHKRCNGHAAGGGLSSHDQLLSESSGDDSAALHGSGLKPGYTIGYTLGGHGYTPGLAVKRRRPARPYAQLQRLQRPCAQAVRACIGLLILACVIATLTVMWLFIDVREQVFSLRTEIEQVVAGSQAVPDDLQKIHSLSRELQQNQTQLTLRVNTIAAQISNLSQQLGVVQTDLRAYTDHLQSNPEPSNIKDLMTNVALMGSQIKDLDNTVRSVKQQQTTLDTVMQTVGKNLTAVESSVAKLSNASLRPPPLEPNVLHELESLRQVVSQASTNISEANSTLTKRLQWLQDDQAKDHKVIEILQDLGQNVTARVKTLEGECAKIDVQNVLNSTITVLKEQVSQDAQRLQLLEHNMPGVPSPPVQAGQAGQAAYQVTPSSIAEGKPAESGSSTNEGAKRESLIPLLTESGITTPGG